MVIAIVVILALQANALWGKTGPLASVKGALSCSLLLTLVLYSILEAF